MIYTIEHIVITFIAGLVSGVISTLLCSRKELTIESIISLLIMAIWLTMHSYSFFFDAEVSWLFDFAGFGAAGNFIGIKLSDVKDRAEKHLKLK